MRKDRATAIELRKSGKSYKAIRDETGIPLSTLSNWFSQVEWSNDLKQSLRKEAARITGMATRTRWEAWRENFRKQARNEFSRLMINPLFITGVCLYWGEGDHGASNSHAKIINTDSRIIALYCKFLREIASVPEERIIAWLILYPDLNDHRCKKYWSNISGIPVHRFYQSQYIHGKHKSRRVPWGVCTIQVNSRELKEKLFTWAELLYNNFQD